MFSGSHYHPHWRATSWKRAPLPSTDSLTLSALGDDYFEVSLIPITLRDTIFGKLAVGGTVNLEVDVLAKYVERNLTFRT